MIVVVCIFVMYTVFFFFGGCACFFFLMIRRPPRSTQSRSSAASDVYKRQLYQFGATVAEGAAGTALGAAEGALRQMSMRAHIPVSYTHLRAHETVLDLVCRLLLEKKKAIS